MATRSQRLFTGSGYRPPVYHELENIESPPDRADVPQQQQPGINYVSPTQQQQPGINYVSPTQQQQPGINYVSPPQVTSGPVQQVSYYVPQVQQTGMAVQQTGYPGPSDFLILALVTLIVCGLLNFTSLCMGIPAVIFAALSNHQRTVNNNYKAAKKNSDIAIGLIIATIVYTLVLGVIITGIAVGVSRFGINGRSCYGYYYYPYC